MCQYSQHCPVYTFIHHREISSFTHSDSPGMRVYLDNCSCSWLSSRVSRRTTAFQGNTVRQSMHRQVEQENETFRRASSSPHQSTHSGYSILIKQSQSLPFLLNRSSTLAHSPLLHRSSWIDDRATRCRRTNQINFSGHNTAVEPAGPIDSRVLFFSIAREKGAAAGQSRYRWSLFRAPRPTQWNAHQSKRLTPHWRTFNEPFRVISKDDKKERKPIVYSAGYHLSGYNSDLSTQTIK